MATNQKTEKYLAEVLRGMSENTTATRETFSADEITIPTEEELQNLEDVTPSTQMISDEEFLKMLAEKNQPEEIEEPVEIQENISEPEEISWLEEPKEEVQEEETLKNKAQTDDLSLGNVIDFDEESTHEDERLKDILSGDEQDLMNSLDLIVKEINSEEEDDEEDGFDEELDDFTEDSFEQGEEFDNLISLDEEPAEEFDEEELEANNKKSKKKKSRRKSRLLEKIKNLFFRIEEVEPVTEEELEKQRLQKAAQKEEKKRAAVEAKKQKATEKKEAAKKKKEEQAAKKAAKPEKKKKPKKPKEPVSPEEIVHIKPMFLVFLTSVTAGIVLLAVTVSNSFSYNLAISSANNSLSKQRYEEAFQTLSGLELADVDKNMYESVRILMRVEKQYNSYVNYAELDMPERALDSLLKAVKNYDKYVDEAQSYGVKDKLDGLFSNVEYALSASFGVDLAKARQWNALEDSNEYTKQIMLCTGSY